MLGTVSTGSPSTFADYNAGPTQSGGPHQFAGAAQARPGEEDWWTLGKCKQAFLDYLGNKTQEINEQKDARRYYHGSQWTADQVKTLQKRKQPVMTYNRIARKIDGVVGLIERLRQDPRAFPRTPKHEEAADLATAVVRYVLDEQRWREKSPECARDGAIDGIGGVEIVIEAGDQGDPEIGLEILEPDSFFYDSRSYRSDFSDASYMGYAKWIDVDVAKEQFPDLQNMTGSYDAGELSTNPDRERKWFSTIGQRQMIRLVDLWYQKGGKWCFSIFTGSMKLADGVSYLVDEKGKTFCKYIAFSGNIDQDGDRYGFVRNMRSAQDGINAKKSKQQHILSSRRLITTRGAAEDIEATRREWARPDGVVVVNGIVGESIKAEDQSVDFAGWSKVLADDLAEIENFGPNPALIGQGIENKSGRAIALLQQAGIAELGPYILAYRGWKLRVYRAIWNAARTNWKAERFIRVTDDDGLAQFIQINAMGVNPDTGLPDIINRLGALDVDIIIDEGPDSVNMQADAYDTLAVLARGGLQIPPKVLIELSSLSGQVKKRILDMMDQAAQPNPVVQAMAAKKAFAELAVTEADADQKRSAAILNLSKAMAPPEIGMAPPEPNTGAALQPPVGPAAPPMGMPQPAGMAAAGPLRPMPPMPPGMPPMGAGPSPFAPPGMGAP